jgi:hypothetical protein
MVSVNNKNDARLNALETLRGVIETHRPVLEEAFAERGAIWLLPGPVREAIADILRAAGGCDGTDVPKEEPLRVAGEGLSRIG